jgi:hypothetical protein
MWMYSSKLSERAEDRQIEERRHDRLYAAAWGSVVGLDGDLCGCAAHLDELVSRSRRIMRLAET